MDVHWPDIISVTSSCGGKLNQSERRTRYDEESGLGLGKLTPRRCDDSKHCQESTPLHTT